MKLPILMFFSVVCIAPAAWSNMFDVDARVRDLQFELLQKAKDSGIGLAINTSDLLGRSNVATQSQHEAAFADYLAGRMQRLASVFKVDLAVAFDRLSQKFHQSIAEAGEEGVRALVIDRKLLEQIFEQTFEEELAASNNICGSILSNPDEAKVYRLSERRKGSRPKRS